MSHIPHTVASRPCIDFLNSRWTDHRGSGRVNDDLEDAGWRRWFLARWGYEVTPGPAGEDLAAAAALRTALRSVLEAWALSRPAPAGALAEVQAAAARSEGRRVLDLSGPSPQVRFEPARRDWSWVLGELVASAAELMAGGDPRRLKSCANPSCTWLFYDDSHNLSRRWCDPLACGNLLKVRAHRARRAEGA